MSEFKVIHEDGRKLFKVDFEALQGMRIRSKKYPDRWYLVTSVKGDTAIVKNIKNPYPGGK